jgi:two-component system chemotaxis response regulator CheB
VSTKAGKRPGLRRDVVVIGASAGGVEALRSLAQGLPGDVPASVLVVMHLARAAPSALPQILSRSGPLPARYATDGEAVARGVIYVAPPDRHLVLVDSVMKLEHEAAEHRSRPAVDPLFRSAAIAYGPRVIGVVLSGTLDDGSEGLLRIKEAGGTAVVQDPEDAAFDSMPRSALDSVPVDHCLPAADMGRLLARLVQTSARRSAARRLKAAPLGGPLEVLAGLPAPRSSMFSCPDCGGVLWEQDRRGQVGFRCRVGHAFSLKSLSEAQDQELEKTLWIALRALEERQALLHRMSERTPSPTRSQRFTREEREMERRATELRLLLGAASHAVPGT